jgi:hypothetical protein
MSQNTTDYGTAGPIVTFGGLRANQSNSNHAYTAMNKQGLTIAPGFFFIEPFVAGREVTLATVPAKDTHIVWIIYAFAGLVALLGMNKYKNLGRPKRTPAKPAQANPVAAARRAGAYSLAEMPPNQMIAAQPTAELAPQKPKRLGGNKMWLVGVGLIAALVTGQSWVFGFLPLIMVGLFYLGMRNGIKSVTLAINEIVENLTGKKPTPQTLAVTAPLSALSSWATVQAPTGAVVQPAKVSQAKPLVSPHLPNDGGPIRPGFSFKDLLPKSKRNTVTSSDPFERLAQQRQQDKNASTRR